jgi:PleD family two-component response regulator
VLLFGGEKVAVTCSIGVAQYRKGESPKDLIDRADRAVYEAKKDRPHPCGV